MNYYAVVFSLRPPNLLRHGPLLERENVCNFQEWCPHKTRRDSKSPRRTKNTTRSKFTTRSIFSTAGSFGCGNFQAFLLESPSRIGGMAHHHSERKNRLNINFLGGTCRGRPGRDPGRRPGPKASTPSLRVQENKVFLARTSLTRRRGRP